MVAMVSVWLLWLLCGCHVVSVWLLWLLLLWLAYGCQGNCCYGSNQANFIINSPCMFTIVCKIQYTRKNKAQDINEFGAIGSISL